MNAKQRRTAKRKLIAKAEALGIRNAKFIGSVWGMPAWNLRRAIRNAERENDNGR